MDPYLVVTERMNLCQVLFRFEDEWTVVPRASEWFGFFDGVKLVRLVPALLTRASKILSVSAGIAMHGTDIYDTV